AGANKTSGHLSFGCQYGLGWLSGQGGTCSAHARLGTPADGLCQLVTCGGDRMARMTKPDLHPARLLGENEDDAARPLVAAAAQASGEMNPELDLDDVHLWLGNLGLMLMSWMERAPEAKAQHRRVIETLVLPGLVNRQDGDAGARNGAPGATTG